MRGGVLIDTRVPSIPVLETAWQGGSVHASPHDIRRCDGKPLTTRVAGVLRCHVNRKALFCHATIPGNGWPSGLNTPRLRRTSDQRTVRRCPRHLDTDRKCRSWPHGAFSQTPKNPSPRPRGSMMLFCVTASGAGAQDRIADSTSRHSGIVKLPVVDKQDIRFTRVSVNNVPIQASTSGITQDQYGFLWFGTLDGLFRYDGYNLKTYRHDAGNPNSLSENTSNLFTGIGPAFFGSPLLMEGSTDWTRLRTRSRIIGMTLAISRA